MRTVKELPGVRYYYEQDGQTVELHFIDNKLIRRVLKFGEHPAEEKDRPGSTHADPARADHYRPRSRDAEAKPACRNELDAMNIPDDLLAKIDEAITHYPVSKRSASLPLLHLWQEHFGFISRRGDHVDRREAGACSRSTSSNW